MWRDQFQNKFQNQIYRQERAEVCNDNTLAEHGVERGKPSGGLCATNRRLRGANRLWPHGGDDERTRWGVERVRVLTSEEGPEAPESRGLSRTAPTSPNRAAFWRSASQPRHHSMNSESSISPLPSVSITVIAASSCSSVISLPICSASARTSSALIAPLPSASASLNRASICSALAYCGQRQTGK